MNELVLPGLVHRRAEMAGELEKAQARVRGEVALGRQHHLVQPEPLPEAERAKDR